MIDSFFIFILIVFWLSFIIIDSKIILFRPLSATLIFSIHIFIINVVYHKENLKVYFNEVYVFIHAYY